MKMVEKSNLNFVDFALWSSRIALNPQTFITWVSLPRILDIMIMIIIIIMIIIMMLSRILDIMVKTIFQGPAPFRDHRIEKLNNKSNDPKINEWELF